MESFLKWREGYYAELEKAGLRKKADMSGRLTGKQWFMAQKSKGEAEPEKAETAEPEDGDEDEDEEEGEDDGDDGADGEGTQAGGDGVDYA